MFKRKKKGQNDKQRSTKHTHKTKDRVTRTPLKTGGKLMCSGRVSRSCFTSGIHVLRHQFSTEQVNKTLSVCYSMGMTSIFTLLMTIYSMKPQSSCTSEFSK